MNEKEVFENRHFILSKWLLMTIGCWPFANQSLKSYLRVLIIVALHSMMIPQMIKLYVECHEEIWNQQILAENVTGFLYFQGVLSKLYMSVYSEKKFRRLYKEMTKDYKEIQDPNDRMAMLEFWNIARILCITYASYMFIALFVFVFTPVALPAICDLILPLNESRPKVICYYAEYFIDQEKYLWPLVAHTFVCVAISLLVISSVDTSYISVTYHVLALYNLINCRFKLLRECVKKRDNEGEEQIHHFVMDTIKIHKKTIDFAEEVRTAYNAVNFYTFGLSVIALAMGTIDVVENLTNPEILLRIGLVWIGLIAYLFLINWPGQKFLDSNDDLLESIWCCNWYILPVKTKFLLKFMMMRCSIPCELTAGPLFQLNFFNYGLILRTAFSYFTAVTSLS